MSWTAYVSDQLYTPGQMCSAGIYGLDGGEWAQQGVLKPLPQDITRLISIIQGREKDFNGIRVGGMSFLYINHDPQEGCITLNRINAPSDEEKYVCCGYLSKGCFIFGAVVGNYRMGNCSKVACRLRDYLKQVGY